MFREYENNQLKFECDWEIRFFLVVLCNKNEWIQIENFRMKIVQKNWVELFEI